MARFARDCMHKMNETVKKLELSLGPDTADLACRFGLHSGPCTAGVLRGERARFVSPIGVPTHVERHYAFRDSISFL